MKPTQQDKQQLSGIAGGGGRNSTSSMPRMGKAEKQMAMAMYGDAFNGDEKKAYAEWAKKAGKKGVKAIAEARKHGRLG